MITPEQRQRAEALFDEALDLEASERPAFLAQACADLPTIQAEVESLLLHYEQAMAAMLLKQPASATPHFDSDEMSRLPDAPPALTGYEVLSELGRGGMGVVYLARQRGLNRHVALKVLRRAVQADPEERARFRTEAEAVARLQHPNIVQIYEVGEHEGRPYFSLEHVDGGSLAQKLAGTPLPARAAAELVQMLAEAIQHAHQRGILHRDLKPANILLQGKTTTDSTDQTDRKRSKASSSVLSVPSVVELVPKITDFGLAKRLEDAPGTVTGVIMGTPSYMSPEQAEGKTHDIGPLSDVYALGAILYETLTGRPPFRGTSVLETLMQVREREPVTPRQLQPGVPRDLETICLKCLQKEPSRRYRSAAALAADLKHFLAGEPISARPVGRVERVWRWCRRNPLAAARAAALVLLLATGLGVVLYREAENRARRDADHAADLVASLSKAETAEVPGIIRDLEPYQLSVRPLLEPLIRQPSSAKEELHARLALLPQDRGQVMPLCAALLEAEPDAVRVIREALGPYQGDIIEGFWKRLEDSREDPSRRLRAACALAAYDRDDPRWANVSQPVADALVADPLRQWVQALRPVRHALRKALDQVYRATDRAADRSVATSILEDYAADDADELAELLKDADPQQFAKLWPRAKAHRERLLDLMKQELARAPGEAPRDPKWLEPDRAVSEELAGGVGMLTERFAFCQTLELGRFSVLAEDLRRCGYRPIRLRPYIHGKITQVGAVWLRDGQDWQMMLGASAAQLVSQDRDWQSRGYVAQDAASYVSLVEGQGTDRYAALWVRKGPSIVTARLDVPAVVSGGSQILPGPQPWTMQSSYGADNRPIACSVALDMGPASPAVVLEHDMVDLGSVDKQAKLRSPVDVSIRWSSARQAFQYSVVWHGIIERGGQEPNGTTPPAGVWPPKLKISPPWESELVFGLDPTEHLERCRELALQGFHPAALSVGSHQDQSLRAASVWQRPHRADGAGDVLAKRQAVAAVTLYRLGQPEAVWPLLQCSPEPRVRSYLIQQLPAFGADPGALIAQLNRELERETDAGIKRALVLSLGEHSKEQLPAETRKTLTERLLRAYWTDPDPGFHSAAEWLLRRWGLKEELRTSEEALAAQDPSPDRNWYVNRHGQTLAVIRGPTDFRMGSPVYEPEREAGEDAHFRRIPRSFALATKEITIEQYRQRDDEAEPVEPFSPEWDGPMIWITWFKAAQYCNWLTIEEGMDKSQRCYEPNDMGKYAEGMRVKPDHLHLTGYRLPTEAEWELACRAGAVTSRFYGSAEELLGRYATAPVNSRDHAVAVGLRLPNDLGMFDMYGNAWEWCQDAVKRPYKIANPWHVIEDIEDPIKEIRLEPRVLRGGAFDTRSPSLRSATRFRGRPGDVDQMVGLRVARTIK